MNKIATANKTKLIKKTLVLVFPVKFGELGIIGFGEPAVCTQSK